VLAALPLEPNAHDLSIVVTVQNGREDRNVDRFHRCRIRSRALS
jgi:hypothetical protein